MKPITIDKTDKINKLDKNEIDIFNIIKFTKIDIDYCT